MRISRDWAKKLVLCLTTCNTISLGTGTGVSNAKKLKVKVKVLRVNGTIRKCQEYAIKYNKKCMKPSSSIGNNNELETIETNKIMSVN